MRRGVNNPIWVLIILIAGLLAGYVALRLTIFH
jgi:hypothetical protein